MFFIEGGCEKELYFTAVKEYSEFCKTGKYRDKNKFKLFTELNRELNWERITENNIEKFVSRLEEKNREQGPAVRWSDIEELKLIAGKDPVITAKIVSDLVQGKAGIEVRINTFRKQGRKIEAGVSLGTHLIGYILAAFDSRKFVPYRESILNGFTTLFNLDKPYTVGEKYQLYLRLCNDISTYLCDEGIVDDLYPLFGQDLMYHLTEVDEFRFNVFCKYLAEIAVRFKKFEEEIFYFLGEIRDLDIKYLEDLKEKYSGRDEKDWVRYRVLERILSGEELTPDDIKGIARREINRFDIDIYQVLHNIYYTQLEDQVRYILRELYEILREKTGQRLPEAKFNRKAGIKDFYWQDKGGDSCWLALFPENYDSYRNAAHLTLFISGTHIVYGLDLGNKLVKADNNYESNLAISTPGDMPELENVLEKYEEVKDEYFYINDQEVPGGNTGEEKFFWYTADPLEIDFTGVEEGDALVFQALHQVGERKGSMKRFRQDIEKIKPGDKLIGFHTVHGMNGVYTLLEAESPLSKDRIRLRVTGHLSRPLGEKKVKENVSDELHLYDKSVQQLEEETYQEIEKLFQEEKKEQESTDVGSQAKFKVPEVDFAAELKIDSLYFFPEVKERLLDQIQLNLRRGKHIILAGPTGTGKSMLAKEICEFYRGGNYDIVTASSSQFTGDTIGCPVGDNGGDKGFVPGLILDCFRDGEKPANRWLIMDELNQVDPKKFFGPLFLAQNGDRVVPGYWTASGDNIVIKSQKEDEIILRENVYIIPEDWRIISTVNTSCAPVQREINGALKRQFAVIPVPAPRNIDTELIKNYLICWDIEDDSYCGQVAELWNMINEVEKIGPAVIEDVYFSLLAGGDFAAAVVNHVLLQFEGICLNEVNDFVARLDSLDFFTLADIRWIEMFAEDFFWS
ncbi:MAG: AAA family ATPase [Halanaerobiaceae bacterium]